MRLWCTKRVKSTDAGRPVFQKYGSTRIGAFDPLDPPYEALPPMVLGNIRNQYIDSMCHVSLGPQMCRISLC